MIYHCKGFVSQAVNIRTVFLLFTLVFQKKVTNTLNKLVFHNDKRYMDKILPFTSLMNIITSKINLTK